MIKFMLAESVHEFRFINKRKCFFQWNIKAHFFFQSPGSCLQSIFTRTRMAATSIRPESAAVVFVNRSLLQQELATAVKNENTECPMQQRLFMRLHFFHHSQRNILFINQYYLFHSLKLQKPKESYQSRVASSKKNNLTFINSY